MKYYRLEHQNNINVIGSTYPQSQKIKSELNWEAPNHIMSVWGKFPLDIYVPDLILHPKAKITDLISSSPIRHPIISNKLKRIIKKYRNQGLEFVPTYLIAVNEKIPYWIMHGYKMDYQYINFDKSIIITIGVGQKKINDLNIKSANSLKIAIEKMTVAERLWIDKLVLLGNINDDIFFLDRVNGSNYYVSQTLKNEIEQAGCTGIEFEPIDEA